MSVYIQGFGNISIQNTFGQQGLPEPIWYNEPYVRCIDPDFKNYVSPNEARRMSKLIKRAIASAKEAISVSGIEMPDAIISGTGLGCIEETEKFLTAMIDNDEKFLQPTYFIQSTHNTISSQIAINLKCHGHNNTFVHGGISFESALMETMILFTDNKIKTALVGGYDEMTPAYFKLLDRVGFWKKEVASSANLNKTNTTGSMAGEGSVAMMLSSQKNDKSIVSIDALEIQYKPKSLDSFVEEFLKRNGKTTNDIDLVLLGMNGNVEEDESYKNVASRLFSNKAQAWYKHLCGEYFTSSAFGVWVAANCLKTKEVPAYIKLNDSITGKMQNVLIINHYQDKNYTLTLLSAC